eukprot:1012236-Amphidinium_carterae.1
MQHRDQHKVKDVNASEACISSGPYLHFCLMLWDRFIFVRQEFRVAQKLQEAENVRLQQQVPAELYHRRPMSHSMPHQSNSHLRLPHVSKRANRSLSHSNLTLFPFVLGPMALVAGT